MKLLIFWGALLLSACVSRPSPPERRVLADDLAANQGWQWALLNVKPFALATYLPQSPKPGAHLTIYIEGDGHAWENLRVPSKNPTPIQPTALLLALAHPEGPAAYLARPCQFVPHDNAGCDARYWTGARYDTAVVTASDRALSALKTRFGAEQLTLVGYSGGAVVATLLAERRTDVARLVTVAGNVDHIAWTRFHQVTPLLESLDPAQDKSKLMKLPQWHFVGSRDRIVPAHLIQAFTQDMPLAQTITLEDYDHSCCWAAHWAELWTRINANTAPR